MIHTFISSEGSGKNRGLIIQGTLKYLICRKTYKRNIREFAEPMAVGQLGTHNRYWAPCRMKLPLVAINQGTIVLESGRSNVTIWRHLSLVGQTPRMIPGVMKSANRCATRYTSVLYSYMFRGIRHSLQPTVSMLTHDYTWPPVTDNFLYAFPYQKYWTFRF